MRAIDRADLVRVVTALEPVGERFILIGGCAPWFLLDAAFAPRARATMDLDFVFEVLTHIEYTRLEERLREQGFRHDIRQGAPRCRWLLGSIQIDIQSASPEAADFGSPWFSDAILRAEKHRLDENMTIRVIGPAHFLATKLDAFFSRGASDYMESEDLEDIVGLLEGCSRLDRALNDASPPVFKHVTSGLRRLRGSRLFLDALPGHLSWESPKGSESRILLRMDHFIGKCSP